MEIVNEGEKWREVLSEISIYDTYHTFDYHKLYEPVEGRKACLFYFRYQDHCAALPLLIKESQVGYFKYKDATSIYGYSGPITSPTISNNALASFYNELAETLKELNLVTLFVRLHPVLNQQMAEPGIGILAPAGKTVSIDLTLPISEQKKRFRSNHKRGINKLRRQNVVCEATKDPKDLEKFIFIYNATMDRIGAADSYYLPADYFKNLVDASDYDCMIFVCRYSGRVICAGLFTVCQKIVQYHLGGTDTEYMHMAPTKLMFDTVRLWATEKRYSVFHLGGGVGGSEDSLFHFKKGFSDRIHEFKIWKWILNEDLYRQLSREYDIYLQDNYLERVDVNYFPSYRSPVRQI